MIYSALHRPTRRGFCLCCLAATTFGASGGWLAPDQVFAQSRNIVDSIRAAAAETPISVRRLRGNVSVLEGSGGNIAVLTGPDGKVLVDAGITASKSRIQDALASLGGDPVRHLINSHWHFDHTDGNEWLRKEGAAIIAHENTRKHLAKAERVADWDFTFPEASPASMPTEVFAKDKTLKLNSQTIAMQYYGPAHTDSDISVMFEEADVLHAADTYWNGVYPFIDYSTGGSIGGTIAATEANLRKVSDSTIVIPGHGQPVSNKSQLVEYRDMLVTLRGKTADLKKQGRSLAETISSKPTAPYDAKWGNYAVGPDLFTKLLYEGV